VQVEGSEHHFILVGVVALLVKVVWDWLKREPVEKQNGDKAELKMLLHELNERQKKMWERMLGGREHK